MPVITTGLKDAPVCSRLEIRTFLQDKDVLNLYLLAIDHMQKIDQSQLDSWFQLAAIHGRPYIPYDNVGVKGSFGGYCTHSSILFPTWHRPYLALFEQSITKHIFEFACKYKSDADRKKYTAAAERFRIPYWDWASEATLPDTIAKQETVTVCAPDGTQSIRNPLFGYKFNPVYSDFGDGLPDEKTWESWPETLRYPTTTDATGKSQPDAMQAQLKNNALTLRDRTYNLLTQAKDYGAFATDDFTGTEQNPAHYDSLESIHNQIHGLAGNNGHMGVVDYAAYDPIFWMHHVNVDRIFAIWQALNPDAFVIPKVTQAGTFTTKPGSTENAETPLTPFRVSDSKFWDSNGVRDTHTFKYTYPETAHLDSLSAQEKGIRVRKEVNRLYGKTSPVSAAAPSVFSGLPTTTPAAQAPAQPSKPAAASAGAAASDYHEWVANIVVEKYAVNTTFFVHIFLGEFSNDSKQWGVDPNLIGSHVVFANNATFTGCHKCRDAFERKKLITGQIPLTGILGTRLGVSQLQPEQIISYLQKNLHWRVQRHDGTPIDHTNLPSLKISVGHAIVAVPQSANEFAKWGDIQLHTAVTTGRPGGVAA